METERGNNMDIDTGIHEGMTAADYHAAPGISSSALKAGQVSMAHMREYVTAGGKDATPAMRWGTLIHAAVLEPEVFSAKCAIWRGRPLKSGARKGEITLDRTGAEWASFVQEEGGGGCGWIITADEQAALLRMQASVHADPLAHQLIASHAHEVSMFWDDPMYGRGKARLDGWHNERASAFDLKTTANIVPGRFLANAERMHYHVQFGWYSHGCERVSRWPWHWHIITLEQSPPYAVVVYEVDDGVLEAGAEAATDTAKAYRASEVTGSWPGPCEGVQVYERPQWAVPEVELDFTGTQ